MTMLTSMQVMIQMVTIMMMMDDEKLIKVMVGNDGDDITDDGVDGDDGDDGDVSEDDDTKGR